MVDRLVVVSNDAQLRPERMQFLNHRLLEGIDDLVFIDHKMTDAIGQVFSQLLVGLKLRKNRAVDLFRSDTVKSSALEVTAEKCH